MVGAGAEITIEQWGSDKLVQIGFYHCYMQVQDIVIFKNFLLLSDAYDSLHFLVYRESDKSLTLLAKDYEPTNMYAAGLLSRGGTLSFVCHDDRQNLTFLSYAPRDAQQHEVATSWFFADLIFTSERRPHHLIVISVLQACL